MKCYKSNRGFTLIEMVVVTGILVLCGGLIASVIFNTLKGSKKSSNTNYLAQNGNYALTYITDVISRTDQVVGTCDNTSKTSVQLYNSLTNTDYTIACGASNITIAQVSRDPTVTNLPAKQLFDAGVRLAPGCSITCSQVSGAPVVGAVTPNPFVRPLIQISFSLTDAGGSTNADSRAQSDFKTSAVLRNYQQ